MIGFWRFSGFVRPVYGSFHLLHLFQGESSTAFSVVVAVALNGSVQVECTEMKNAKMIAAFGVIGALVLLAATGAVLAKGVGEGTSNMIGDQTCEKMGAGNGQMDRIQSQDRLQDGSCGMNGTTLCNRTQAQDCTNGAQCACTGPADQTRTMDQVRSRDGSCLTANSV